MMNMNHALLMNAVLLAGLNPLSASAADADWPQFLGPGSRSQSVNINLPDHWSATENIAWKTTVPGRGWSSPIAWGDRVFLTTVISPDESELPKKGLYAGGERPKIADSEHRWMVQCLDLSSGKLLWERVVHHSPPPSAAHSKNSYASETPVTDGQRVYAYFGNVGLFCLDMDGHPLWSKELSPHATRLGWGTAASPVLYRDRLYLVNDNEEKSYLLALDKLTGKEAWRVERDEKSNWATPYIWENAKRTEIITPGSGKTRSYDLDGKLLWWFKGTSGITIATPYSDHGLLYVSSGFVADKQRPLYAIRPGAMGDISLPQDKQPQSNESSASIAWSNPTAAPYNPTSLVYESRLYVLYDRGLFGAFDAQTGKPLYQPQPLPEGKHFTASPWAYNGRIFCLNEDGVTFVIGAGDKFELLATNKLADDDMCMATPALAGDRLLIRTSAGIYCVRKGVLQ